ncbi:uncharacterized protein NEMAJ01_0170 [Nematocida major]|uniref:uncharacterized protein n=1 Tax=Nematocida major TaxID=1912982 RepID=UPI002007B953|nr:uncharacterized protein NEMAJ01_0170 [Nematocida major]KAH9385274.1 hypothetical protein NEMAJ01_0170 [Nematocida major]
MRGFLGLCPQLLLGHSHMHELQRERGIGYLQCIPFKCHIEHPSLQKQKVAVDAWRAFLEARVRVHKETLAGPGLTFAKFMANKSRRLRFGPHRKPVLFCVLLLHCALALLHARAFPGTELGCTSGGSTAVRLERARAICACLAAYNAFYKACRKASPERPLCAFCFTCARPKLSWRKCRAVNKKCSWQWQTAQAKCLFCFSALSPREFWPLASFLDFCGSMLLFMHSRRLEPACFWKKAFFQKFQLSQGCFFLGCISCWSTAVRMHVLGLLAHLCLRVMCLADCPQTLF